MPWSKEDYIYLAGFLDGEGCIGVYSRAKEHKGSRQITPSRSYRPRISITNTNKEILLWIQKEFGGSLQTVPAHNNTKQIYRLDMQTFEAIKRLLVNCLPYFRLKKEVALLCLSFPHNIHCNQYTKELTKNLHRRKEQLYLQTLQLNKRGV